MSGVTFPAFENTIEKCHQEDPANGGQSKQMKEQRCERTSHFLVPCFESGSLLQERLSKIAKECNLNHLPLLYFKVVMITKFLNHAQTFDPAYACIDASYITTQLTNLARMHLAKSVVLPIKQKEIIKP